MIIDTGRPGGIECRVAWIEGRREAFDKHKNEKIIESASLCYID
jgi:hypothetical protein